MLLTKKRKKKEEAEEAIEANMDERQPEALECKSRLSYRFSPIMDDDYQARINTDGAFNITYSTPSKTSDEFYRQHFQRYGDAVIIADNNLEINLRAESRDIQILMIHQVKLLTKIFIGGVSRKIES